MNPDRAAAAFWAGYIRNRNVDERTAADGAVAVAGGYALYVAGTQFRTVLGAGWERPLAATDLDVVEGFFAERGTGARFELEASAVTRDRALLEARGYAVAATTTTIFERSLTTRPSADEGPIRVRTTRDRRAWVALTTSAMAERDEPMLERTLQFIAAGASILTIASLDDRDVGAGGVLVTGDLALMVAGGVIPSARGRGVHAALLQARLRLAYERGAIRAAIKADSGSTAERAAVRAGFAPTATTVETARAGA